MKNRRNRILIPSLLLVLFATLKPGAAGAVGFQLDKVAHFLLFFFLAINLFYKFERNRIRWIILAVIFGGLTELGQHFVPGRNMDFFDWMADTMGVLLAFYFYRTYEPYVYKLLFKMGA